ncbi:MAG: polyprenyl synthetase family protein [Rhodanobacteraceae bacterium]
MSTIPAESTAKPIDLDAVQQLAAADMARVDTLIRTSLASDVVLIGQIAEHIIGGGGKRLRPMLHVLAARAAGYGGDKHIKLAAVIEFIHTSTLLHDDVVDESGLRRGRQTANAVWGNSASVLVGDFLYSRAFQLMVDLDSMPVMRILADTTNIIAEGEVLQLLNIGKPDIDQNSYLEVIERKTAVLFAAATELGGLLAGLPDTQVQALRRYGMQLGYAFQIADDLLDYTADSATLGKNIGDDLAEGKTTLPMILAMAEADAATAEMMRTAIEQADVSVLPQISAAIREGTALERTSAIANDFAERAVDALSALPCSPQRDALTALAHYALERRN